MSDEEAVAPCDSGMDGDSVARAEWFWAQLPVNRTWTGLATHEKALVCHLLARAAISAMNEEWRGERALHVVFDGPPGHAAGRFVECETPDGRSLQAGEWHERGDGLWELRIQLQPHPSPAGSPAMIDTLVQRLRAVESGVDFPGDKDPQYATCRHRNPDGPEAADYIETLERDRAMLRRTLKLVHDDLATVPPNSGTGSKEWLDDLRGRIGNVLAMQDARPKDISHDG